MMSDQLFNDSSTVGSTPDIPDIFDVLEGGEDEGAVRYLLGFNGEEGGVGFLGQVDTFGGMEVLDKYVGEGISLGLNGSTYLSSVNTAQSPPLINQTKNTVTVRQVTNNLNNKKRDTSGAKAIHNCDSCGKSFTTKFNLKRHINMHCHKSKENGVPIQGPPSASAPAKKSEKPLNKTGLKSTENQQQGLHLANPQTVLSQNQTVVHSGQGGGAAPYSRVVTVSQTEYRRPEPDSTYKLPSVQTILPVSTVFANQTTVVGTTTNNTFSTIASCDSSQMVSSVSSSGHNTDFGTLPADLFDPDSSRSSPTSPNDSQTGKTTENEGEDDDSPSPVTLTSIPAGWTRKVSFHTGKITYYSPLGKAFCSHEEVHQYFKTFNFSVPVGLFNFDLHCDEDSEEEEDEDESDLEDDELDDEDDDEESICAKRRRNDTHYKSFDSMSPPLGTTPSPGPTPSSSPLASGCSMCEKDSWCAGCGGGGASIYHPAPASALRTIQSKTYLAYIQGLRLGSETMCDWSRDLSSSRSLVPDDGSSAPLTISPWLEKMYAGQTVRGVESLCALRDFMLQEALNVVKFA